MRSFASEAWFVDTAVREGRFFMAQLCALVHLFSLKLQQIFLQKGVDEAQPQIRKILGKLSHSVMKVLIILDHEWGSIQRRMYILFSKDMPPESTGHRLNEI
jgi:hypothetical protein